MNKILFYNNLNILNFNIKKIVYNNKEKFDSSTVKTVSYFEPIYIPQLRSYLSRPPLYVIMQLSKSISSIDRTNYLNPYKMSYTPMVEYKPQFDKSYENIILERAKKLWEMDDTISILFNGEEENLVVCLALIETKPKNKNLKIICLESKDAIPNLPFINEFIVKVSNKDFFNIKNLTPKNIIVVSDVIRRPLLELSYGSVNINQLDLSKLPWKYLLPLDSSLSIDMINPTSIDNFKKESEKINNLIQDHIKYSPIEIVSVTDVLWWFSFAFTQNYLNYRIPAHIIYSIKNIKPNKIDVSKWVNFFNIEDFQLWNIKNYSIQKNLSFFKEHSKTFLKKFLKEYKNLKYQSIIDDDYNPNDENFLILENGEIVYSNELTSKIIEDIV